MAGSHNLQVTMCNYNLILINDNYNLEIIFFFLMICDIGDDTSITVEMTHTIIQII